MLRKNIALVLLESNRCNLLAKKAFQCPKCGTVVNEPKKTWQLTAPLPDKKGRITVTIMGLFECPSCGYRWRGVVSKLKIGSEGVEVEGRGKERVSLGGESVKREGKVIELSIEEIMESEE